MRDEDSDQAVEVLKILRVELVDMAGREVLKADVKAFVGAAVARAAGVHVGLNTHQQDSIKALGLAVAGVDLTLFVGGAPGESPSRVADKHSGAPVGVHQVALAWRHAPEAMIVKTVIGYGARLADQRAALARQAGIAAEQKCARSRIPAPVRQNAPSTCCRHPRRQDGAAPGRFRA